MQYFIDSNDPRVSDLQKAKIGSKNKWQVIPPGIRKSESITKDTARLIIGTEKDLFLITWIGRFTEIKDPFLALEAFKRLQKLDNSKFSMIMIGDGELLDTCKEFSEKNHLGVIFPGWQSNVTSYLAAADILLVTSKNEGFGMVIAEAGLQSVPAVSTNVGGVGEFIIDQGNGILIPNDDAVPVIEPQLEEKGKRKLNLVVVFYTTCQIVLIQKVFACV
jgi:glycosyltransferase involved in cell wall biosynthesis